MDEESSVGIYRPPRNSLAESLDEPLRAILKEAMRFGRDCTEAFAITPAVRHYDHAPDALENAYNLPPKTACRAYRFLRWTLFTTYRRLFSLVFLANSAGLAVLCCISTSRQRPITYSDLTTATSVNLLVSVVARHEHFVNLLFLLFCNLPASTPLVIRCWCAKVYSYGGVHSGCAVAGIMWYLAFAVLVGRHLFIPPYVSTAVAMMTVLLTVLLLCIAGLAYPAVRKKMHNTFEASHRFAGWATVLLFWAQTALLVKTERQVGWSQVGAQLLKTPSFWCLVGITSVIVYPWARLRLRSVRAEVLSEHAVQLHFDHGRMSYGQGLRMSDRPLTETHAFAPIPNANNEDGFSVIVSNAGDWTGRTIRQPPDRIWTRGGPQYGAIYVAQLFRPVIIVATGSGIAPCLSLFRGKPELDCRILWSAPSPVSTYGFALVDEILGMDQNAVIVDTKQQRRPDLVALACRLYDEAQAEAVVVISNSKVTRKVVYGLETRRVPVFAPIFDS